MQTTIMTNARKDRASTLEEIGDELRRYGGGARCDVVQTEGIFAPKLAIITVPPTDNDLATHELTGETAQLEWWQQNNHVLGIGFAHGQEEAADRALAMAARGDFARRDLTVWFDRAWRKFRFFVRSRRDPGNHYKPTGHGFSPEYFAP